MAPDAISTSPVLDTAGRPHLSGYATRVSTTLLPLVPAWYVI